MYGTEFARISGSYSTAFIGTYEVLSQSTAGNSTTFRLYGYFYYGGGTSVGSSSSNFVLDGTTIKTGSYRYYPGYTLLGTKDITVTHNNDGSFPGKSVTISGSSYHISGSASGNLNASPIARYATVTDTTDFNDEGNPKVYFNNPGNFWLYMKIEAGGNDHLITRTDTQIHNPSSPYTWDLTEAERNKLRALCTTSNNLPVRFTVGTSIDGSIANWSYIDKTMTIVNADPTFNNFTFEDINPTTIALTGNNQNVIKGYSNVKVTIPVANKAVAKKEATMSKYRFTCGDKSADILYSDTSDVNGTVSAVPNGTFIVYATDSRNNSTPVQKLANQVIDYSPLTKTSIDTYRSGGVSEEVILQLEGTINIVNFGKKTNAIKTAKVKYRVAKTDKWSAEQDIVLTVANGKFSYNGAITGDLESKGFNISNSYEVEVIVTDELSSVTFTDTFSSGTPNIAYHKNGISVMGKYDVEVGGKFQVGSKCYDKNIMTIFSTSRFDISGSEKRLTQLTSEISVGDKLTLSDSSIKIGKGVKKVLVSATISWWQSTSYYQTRIEIKNQLGNILARSWYETKSDQYTADSMHVTPFLTDVNEGDEISLWFGNGNDLSVNILGDLRATFLTVEVVE